MIFYWDLDKKIISIQKKKKVVNHKTNRPRMT